MPRTPEHENQVPRSASWPKAVRPLSLDEDLMGVDDAGRLYWDGRPVEVSRRLDLSRWQRVGAIIIALAAIAGGLGGAMQGIAAGHDFGCKRGWLTAGCPPRPAGG